MNHVTRNRRTPLAWLRHALQQRSTRPLTDLQCDTLEGELRELLAAGPLTCRLCDARAEVQLVETGGRAYEMLCFDHVADFAKTWADPRVAEWTLVRLDRD
jgi:hypothetical protein